MKAAAIIAAAFLALLAYTGLTTSGHETRAEQIDHALTRAGR